MIPREFHGDGSRCYGSPAGMETGIDVLQRDVKEMWIKDVFYCNAAIDVSLVTKKRSCQQFFESCFQDNAK